MRRLFWTLTVVLLLFCPRLSQGCGDKLLILGRCLRFSALSADRPAAILAYAPEGSLRGRNPAMSFTCHLRLLPCSPSCRRRVVSLLRI